jgi:hypothetical protein
MPRYEIITLVDITRSIPTRSDTDQLKIGQQNNFNSLIQAIGLRSNVEWNRDPITDDGRLPDPFKGKAKHWRWEFDVEREQVFERDSNPVGLLIDDLHGVPVITGLTETTEIKPAAFQTKGDFINTVVKVI